MVSRSQLEHIIRAAGAILGEDDVVIIGSQAVLGTIPNPPRSVMRSNEVDIAAWIDPTDEKAMSVNGALGEGTQFHSSFGYYAEGVSLQSLPRLPRGWVDRAIRVSTPNTTGVAGWCPEPHDLCISKLLARRPKDREFTEALVGAGMVTGAGLLDALADTDVTSEERLYLLGMVKRVTRPGRHNALRRRLKVELKEAEEIVARVKAQHVAEGHSPGALGAGVIVVTPYRRKNGSVVRGYRRRRPGG